MNHSDNIVFKRQELEALQKALELVLTRLRNDSNPLFLGGPTPGDVLQHVMTEIGYKLLPDAPLRRETPMETR